MTHVIKPYRIDKNLGKAYNDAMQLLPDGATAVITDIDVLLLTPDTPTLIDWYASNHPDKVLTCYTNRISPLSRYQLYGNKINNDSDIKNHIAIAESLREVRTVTSINGDISGFLMVVPKSIWQQIPFPETGKCLGVDTDWNRMLRRKGVPLLRMDGVYVWHTYRIMNGIGDKKHLL